MTANPPAAPAEILLFDRAQLRRQRERAARRFHAHDFLFAEVADRLLDRLGDITRSFPLAADIGCHGGMIAARLAGLPAAERRIGTLVQLDHAPAMAARASAHGPVVAADEELLPFAQASLDLVLSGLSLQGVNDLPGVLAQAARALKPDGLLLAALLGGRSLHELRDALLAAEAEVTGGASPRVAPFVDVREAGALLQRAGFALPVVDSDVITVTYDDALALMRDLRGMGLGNALAARRRGPTPRSVLARAAVIYGERYRGVDGRVAASFEVVYLHGWKPAANQQRPLRPGSARARLADALGTVERSTGERTTGERGAGERAGRE
jgi:NADH dehydrogenase [ubiquinone] 1 alpha subcomplex assembly factor 5